MTATGPTHETTRGLGADVKALISDISALFRQEIQLAKTEASERVESAVQGGQMLMGGIVLGIGALGVLLAAFVVALSGWLESIGMAPSIANTVAALAVALVVGLVGWGMISAGVKRLKATNFKMERTTHSLSEDTQAVKERL